MAQLRIKNEREAADILISKSPLNLFTRELTKNSIEASTDYILNKKIDTPVFVDIWKAPFSLDPDGSTADKLMWGNFGGLTKPQMKDAVQLFSSVGKQQKADKNYGIGMIMSTLGFTDIALLSKKDGKIHLCIVQQTEDGFGTLEHVDETSGEQLGDVVEIDKDTLNLKDYNMDTDHDYTVLVLLGRGPNRLKQDTFFNPVTIESGEKTRLKKWLQDELLRRFWAIPKNLKIRLGKDVHDNGTSGRIHLELLPELHRHWENISRQQQPKDHSQHEVVSTSFGFDIHYEYNAINENSKRQHTFLQGNRAVTRPVCGLVFENEMFDVCDTSTGMIQFLRDAGVMGQHMSFSVYIEFNSDYEMTLDRSQIFNTKDPKKKPISLRDFAREVMIYAPQWWKDKAKDKREQQKVVSDTNLLQTKVDFYEKLKKAGKSAFGKDSYSEIDPNKKGIHDGYEEIDGKVLGTSRGGGGGGGNTDNLKPKIKKYKVAKKNTGKLGTTALSGRIVKKSNSGKCPEIVILETYKEAQQQQLQTKEGNWLAEYDKTNNRLVCNPFCDVIEHLTNLIIGNKKNSLEVKHKDVISIKATDWIAHNKLVDPVLNGRNNMPGEDIEKVLDKVTLTMIGGALEGCEKLITQKAEEQVIADLNALTVNEEVIINGEDARDTESESQLTLEQKVRFEAAGGVVPTKQ